MYTMDIALKSFVSESSDKLKQKAQEIVDDTNGSRIQWDDSRTELVIGKYWICNNSYIVLIEKAELV